VAESIFILSIVIIGGMGNLKGSFYASIFMILLPEVLRFVGLPSSVLQLTFVKLFMVAYFGFSYDEW
jgi:ABC-type branched-subunit amino acid transport system permease subunit